ncbi:MAG: hypothetical protein ABIB46_04120 [bacterium]
MFKKIFNKIQIFFKSKEKCFLCDTCMYDYRSSCNHSEKPNVVQCLDYKKRGKY